MTSQARDVFEGQQPSALGQTMALLGDHWTLLILQCVLRGNRRYLEIRDAIGVSDSILAKRLVTMTEGGLLVKTPYKDGRLRYEYSPSRAGRATWRIFLAAWTWQGRWGDAETSEFVHGSCGANASAVLVCGKCMLPVNMGGTSVRRPVERLGYVGTVPRRHRQGRTMGTTPPIGFTADTLALLGDRWNIALMAAASLGRRRFNEFEKFLGIPPTVLSARLAQFVELGVFEIRDLEGSANRSEYRLTKKGRAFDAVLIQFARWADEHARHVGPASLEIMHDACGRKLLAELACSHCQAVLRRSDVRIELLTLQ
ncbi:winged helix-turn-helix transcriptional regulator [Streptosporangium sp. NPDC087985]|uniref:winged helix-turn-helix transcriptional regulator n=1 Tax=Streptosporangium sp. NPDC087985 TaxID=3366196 RepID=UPI00382451C4